MKRQQLFYEHESDDRIMIKKDKAEAREWKSDLEYMKEELDYLLDIEDLMLDNSLLYQELRVIRKENSMNLRILCHYESAIIQAIECDTVECDAFYLGKHERNRKLYLEHKKKYRDIKSRVLSNILLEVKR